MKAVQENTIQIQPLKIDTLAIPIVGTQPLVLNRFSVKAKTQMKEDQARGSSAKNKKLRDGKDFDALYNEALYIAPDGWYGFPASAVRAAIISACRVVGFKMTLAKLSVFVDPDGFDKLDSTPLICIREGQPEPYTAHVRNATGVVDIRIRPMWKPGWKAVIPVTFDLGQFSRSDIVNLIVRVGRQVGIGEGRPDSKSSCGLGYGTFEIITNGGK